MATLNRLRATATGIGKAKKARFTQLFSRGRTGVSCLTVRRHFFFKGGKNIQSENPKTLANIFWGFLEFKKKISIYLFIYLFIIGVMVVLSVAAAGNNSS